MCDPFVSWFVGMPGVDSEPFSSRSRRLRTSVYTWSSRRRTGASTLHVKPSCPSHSILDSLDTRYRPNHRSSSCLATGGVPFIENGKRLLRDHVSSPLRRGHVERQAPCHTRRLTNRWSQLRNHSRAGSLAGAKSTFDFMKQLSILAKLAKVYPPRRAGGGSACSR